MPSPDLLRQLVTEVLLVDFDLNLKDHRQNLEFPQDLARLARVHLSRVLRLALAHFARVHLSPALRAAARKSCAVVPGDPTGAVNTSGDMPIRLTGVRSLSGS